MDTGNGIDLTVITLSYNQESFLSQAVDSVLRIPSLSVQYIIVDPGSTDGSREYLSALTDPRIALVLEPDSGPSDGLNKGLDRALGRYVAYLNADDILLSGAVPGAVAALDARPDCGVLVGNGYIIDRDGHRVRRVVSDRPSSRGYVYGTHVYLQQATIFRAEAIRDLRFNVANRTSWDGEFLVTALLAGVKAMRHNADLGCFRVYPGTVTTSPDYAQALRADHRRLFRLVIGRDMRPFDDKVGLGLRVIRRGAQALARRGCDS